MVSELSLPKSQSVDAADVARFLVSRGWQKFATKRPNISVLRKDSEFEVLLPLSDQYADYEERLHGALVAAARAEKLSIDSIIDNILSPAADILKFRVQDQVTESGVIPLLEGLELIDGIRRGLASVACSIISPQAFHPRLHRTEADLFLKSCKLGTRQGSFVAQVLCPIEPLPFEDAQLGIFEQPFGRKVTAQFIRSLSWLITAIDDDNFDQIVSENTPISANFCEAIVGMQPPGDSSTLTIEAGWSTKISMPSDIPTNVRIRKRHFTGFQRIGVTLRKPKTELPKQTFAGYVEQLKGEPNLEGQMAGEVILAIVSSDEEWFRARVNFRPQDYATACDAHKESSLIVLRGVLKRGARLNEIVDYDDFAML